MSRFTLVFTQRRKDAKAIGRAFASLRSLRLCVKFFSETGRLRYFLSIPAHAVGGFHAIHLVIRGDHELVQGIAVDAECRRSDTNPDTRRTVPSERQRELRHRTLDAHAQVFNLRA